MKHDHDDNDDRLSATSPSAAEPAPRWWRSREG
jgi:hypothetical protein